MKNSNNYNILSITCLIFLVFLSFPLTHAAQKDTQEKQIQSQEHEKENRPCEKQLGSIDKPAPKISNRGYEGETSASQKGFEENNSREFIDDKAFFDESGGTSF